MDVEIVRPEAQDIATASPLQKRMERFFLRTRPTFWRNPLKDRAPKPVCPLQHRDMAWLGPPQVKERGYMCVSCLQAVYESELRASGFNFDTIKDYEIHAFFDEKLAHARR